MAKVIRFDPATGLYQRWRCLWDADNRAQTDDELKAISDQSAAIADELTAMPAQTVMGVLVKLKCAVDQEADLSVGSLLGYSHKWQEAEALLPSVH